MTSTAPSAVPAAPIRELKYDNFWIMYYRHGMNPNCSKGFFCDGPLKVAQERAMEHCQIMGYRFIMIRPLISNIEEEESIQLGRKQG